MTLMDLLTGDEERDKEQIMFYYNAALKKMNTKIEILRENFA